MHAVVLTGLFFAQAEYIYNSLFTCVGAGAPTAACDNACHVCAGNTTYGTYAQQYTALLLAAQQSNAQHPSCPQTCLRATRAITIGCTTTCGGTGLQTNCTFDSIRSSGAGINIPDTVNITKLNVLSIPVVPKNPYAWATLTQGYGSPTNAYSNIPTSTLYGDSSISAGIGLVSTSNPGVFAAPFSGVFTVAASVRPTTVGTSFVFYLGIIVSGVTPGNGNQFYSQAGSIGAVVVDISRTIYLNKGDTVTVQSYSNVNDNNNLYTINYGIMSVQLVTKSS